MDPEKINILLSANLTTESERARLQNSLDSIQCARRDKSVGEIEIHLYIDIKIETQVPVTFHLRPYESDPFNDYRRFIMEVEDDSNEWVLFVEQGARLLPDSLRSLSNFTLAGPLNGRIGKSYIIESPKITLTGSAIRVNYLQRFFGANWSPEIFPQWEDLKLLEYIWKEVSNSTIEEDPGIR